ncbi:MAG: hypothetical protein ACRC8S_01870 [Fimbriiglobus sp.]
MARRTASWLGLLLLAGCSSSTPPTSVPVPVLATPPTTPATTPVTSAPVKPPAKFDLPKDTGGKLVGELIEPKLPETPELPGATHPASRTSPVIRGETEPPTPKASPRTIPPAPTTPTPPTLPAERPPL